VPPLPKHWVLVRNPEGKLKSQALLCTGVNVEPEQIINWYARSWQMEVTSEEVRAHLGVETQRQWSDLAIARTTPALLGHFSLVTLLAHQLTHKHKFPVAQSPWYSELHPTFADALALVRQHIWQHVYFCLSQRTPDSTNTAAAMFKRLSTVQAYAN
jgi:hypothetical protein